MCTWSPQTKIHPQVNMKVVFLFHTWRMYWHMYLCMCGREGIQQPGAGASIDKIGIHSVVLGFVEHLLEPFNGTHSAPCKAENRTK